MLMIEGISGTGICLLNINRYKYMLIPTWQEPGSSLLSCWIVLAMWVARKSCLPCSHLHLASDQV